MQYRGRHDMNTLAFIQCRGRHDMNTLAFIKCRGRHDMNTLAFIQCRGRHDTVPVFDLQKCNVVGAGMRQMVVLSK